MYQCENRKLYKYIRVSIRLVLLFILFNLFSVQTVQTYANIVEIASKPQRIIVAPNNFGEPNNIERNNPDQTTDWATDQNNKPYSNPQSIGQQQNSCITGYVWLDGNRNGIRDPIEDGVAKVLVKIYDFAGRQSGTDITDGSGYFVFSDLPYGEYHVEFIQPVGFDFPTDDTEEEAEGWTLVTTIDCEEDTDYMATPLVTTASSGPTAISLDSFDAEPTSGSTPAIHIKWVTSAEVDTSGFYLYRSVTGYRKDAVRVTPALVPAQSESQKKLKAYTFNDQTVFPEVEIIYTYWLTERETTGNLIDYGPIHVKLTQASVPNRVYLPLIQK